MKRPLNHRFLQPLLAAGLTAVLILTGCDSFGGEEYRPFVTEILDVHVEPNPVAAGDTAVFTCVVEDSADTTLAFKWFLENTFGVVETDTSQFKWTAPSEAKTYSHKVRVFRPGDADVQSTQERFTVTVTDNN